jgi:hypothetical protein
MDARAERYQVVVYGQRYASSAPRIWPNGDQHLSKARHRVLNIVREERNARKELTCVDERCGEGKGWLTSRNGPKRRGTGEGDMGGKEEELLIFVACFPNTDSAVCGHRSYGNSRQWT